MKNLRNDFTNRQYMLTSDFEYFHYTDTWSPEVDYHTHDFFEIYLLISGKVIYEIEGKSYKLKPLDIILINNMELHKPVIDKGEPYERVVIWVNPDFIKKLELGLTKLDLCFESSSKSKYNLLRPTSDLLNSIKNAYHHLEKSVNSHNYGCELLRNVYFTELLVYLNRAFMDTFDDEIEFDIEHNEKISSVIQYINTNLGEDLSLDNISSKFYMSKYHLLREFKKYAGYSIHQYIHKKRLILSKSLLREGLQVTEVSIRCGFGDYSNFIRSFKKAFGESPKKYFKSNQNI